MTNTTTTTNKFNPLPGKLMLVINELYPAEVVSLWNDYCKSIDDTDHCIHCLCGDELDEVLKDWAPSDIVFSLNRSDERDAYFQVIESTSEIKCFPEWEINDNLDINELIDWLVKDDKWQEYDELKPAADIEL